MDVVKTGIENAGGSLEIDSVPKEGTRIHIRLPLTLAIIPCLIISSDGNPYAIPQISIEELLCLYDEDAARMEYAGDQEMYRLRGNLLPMIRLSEVLHRRESFTEKIRSEIAEKYAASVRNKMENSSKRSLNSVVLRTGNRRFGLIVDGIAGTEETVVKPMHGSVSDLGIYAGATVMGDGRVALILDADGIASHAKISCFQANPRSTTVLAKPGKVICFRIFLCSEAAGKSSLPFPLPRSGGLKK